MPDLLAKGVAVVVGFLLVVIVGALIVTTRPPAGAQQVKAEFDDAYPLIEGMHVRVDGSIAGSVGPIEVNDEGNAVVTLVLNDSIEKARADATAAVRQQDTTGDSYVAFEPGTSQDPLGDEGIVCADYDSCDATLVSPRLDDLLNAFGPQERTGIKLLLVELAKALDRRGTDLNAAALELKPALESAGVALSEVNSQNDALKALIETTENVTGQAAGRTTELARLIEGLRDTFATTADSSEELDAGLEALPETAAAASKTFRELRRTTEAGAPLARDLAANSADLAGAVENLGPFVENASGWIDETTPTLELTQQLLSAAEPTLEVGSENVVTGAFDLTGATADLLNTVLGGEDAFPALFGDDSYGVGDGTLGKRGFGAVAVEPGNLPGYPAVHADRNWLRVSGILNCEAFGRPVEPGCLADVLSSLPGRARTQSGDGRPRAGLKPGSLGPADAYADPEAGADGLLPLDLPDLKLPKIGKLDLNAIGSQLGLGSGGRGEGGGSPGSRSGVGKALGNLIDFLVGP